MKSEKLTHKTLGDKVYEIIKEKIIRWEFQPGQRIIDKNLAEILGVSRSLVRNAFILLEKEGLLYLSRQGIYVTQFSQKDIREVFDIRKLLEIHALQTAIESISAAEIQQIEEMLQDAMQGADRGQMEACYDLDVALHQLIIDRSANDRLKKMYSISRNLNRIVILSDYQHREKVLESLEEHHSLVEALKARNLSEAQILLARHLEKALKRVLENFANGEKRLSKLICVADSKTNG